MKKLIRLLNILIAFLFLFLFLFSIIKRDYIEKIISREIGETYSLLLIFLTSSLLELIPQYVAPHVILLNAKIIGLSIFPMFPLATIGSAIGSILGFEIGRKYSFRFIMNLYSEKEIKSIERNINYYGRWFVLVAAVSPLPYIPLIFGSLNLTRKNFIIFGVIPRIAGLLLLGFILM